jgi:hypothetical protein
MAAQIAVEIRRHLSLRLFVGVCLPCLPFLRLEPETCVRARICFAVYGKPQKSKVLSKCIVLGSPRLTQGLRRESITVAVQYRSVCTGKVYARRKYVIVERCTLPIPDK